MRRGDVGQYDCMVFPSLGSVLIAPWRSDDEEMSEHSIIEIGSADLRVQLLDPNRPHPCHGIRYCRGGYIWMVTTAEGAPLVSGPEHPAMPSAFNGQGLPEVYRHESKDDGHFLTRDASGHGFILGVGEVDGPTGVDGARVLKDCTWEVEPQGDRCRMTTHHDVVGWQVELSREVEVKGNSLISRGKVELKGERPMELEWYAHPFFSLCENQTGVAFDHGVGLESPDGFLVEDARIAADPTQPQHAEGYFSWMQWSKGTPLDARVDHPTLGKVQMTMDQGIDRMPIWANCNTLSIEPYLYRRLDPGSTFETTIVYAFG